MSDQQPKKAYYVHERWTSYSSLIVYADSVAGAKRAVRNGDEDNIEVMDTIVGATPEGITARRAPKEDRR